MIHRKFIALFLFAALLMPAAMPRVAHADLLITPTRIVFEGRDRSKVVTLINSGSETRTYRMSWKLMKMTEQGNYDDVETFTNEAGENISAEDMVRFSPRQVTIEPQGRQRIRLSLRRPADLPPGEYRAHMMFTRLVDDGPPAGLEVPEQGQSMALLVNMAFTIPIIVREGASTPVATLSNPKFEVLPANIGGGTRLNFDVNSTSSFSTFGRVTVFDRGGNQVGLLNNVAVFPEIERRKISIPVEPGVASLGQLTAVYEGLEEYAGTIFDRQTFTVR